MTATLNVHQAKTHFSNILDRAHAGEEIIIAKAGKPWAKLVKIEEAVPFKRVPGGWPATGDIPDTVWFDPMTEEELADWEGRPGDLV